MQPAKGYVYSGLKPGSPMFLQQEQQQQNILKKTKQKGELFPQQQPYSTVDSSGLFTSQGINLNAGRGVLTLYLFTSCCLSISPHCRNEFNEEN